MAAYIFLGFYPQNPLFGRGRKKHVYAVADPGGQSGHGPQSVLLYTLAPLMKKISIESPQVAAVSRFRSNAARDEDVETFKVSLCSFPLWTPSIWI